jgi:hypothetical protein
MASGSGAVGVTTLRSAAWSLTRNSRLRRWARRAEIDAVLEMGEASVVALVGDGQGIVPIAGKSAHTVTPDLDFDLGEAFEVPGVAMAETRILLARRDLLRRCGLEAEKEGVFEVTESGGVCACEGGNARRCRV